MPRIPNSPHEYASIWTPWVQFHLLKDSHAEELYLIDGGFLGGLKALQKALHDLGWGHLPVRGILLTHGHLDHVWNIAALAAATGAWVAAPSGDEHHCAGQHPYRGWSQVCGWLESVGRAILGFSPFTVTRWLTDHEILPVAGGLEVVHLPGHTAGHAGYYLREARWLFTGDLFASFGPLSHFPPAILNTDSNALKRSVHRVLSMDLDGVIPNHGLRSSPAEHLSCLQKLASRPS